MLLGCGVVEKVKEDYTMGWSGYMESMKDGKFKNIWDETTGKL